jgi:hypothetical protein
MENMRMPSNISYHTLFYLLITVPLVVMVVRSIILPAHDWQLMKSLFEDDVTDSMSITSRVPYKIIKMNGFGRM